MVRMRIMTAGSLTLTGLGLGLGRLYMPWCLVMHLRLGGGRVVASPRIAVRAKILLRHPEVFLLPGMRRLRGPDLKFAGRSRVRCAAVFQIEDFCGDLRVPVFAAESLDVR